MEDIWLTSNCNNRFEVSSLSRLCSVLHSWTFWGGLALLSLLEHFHKVSLYCLVGRRKNNSTKKSFIWLFSVCFSSSISEASKIFPPIDGPWRIFLTPSLNVYLRISCIFFFLNFWINKRMRAESLFLKLPLTCSGEKVWLAVPCLLDQHGPAEGLQERHQPVSWSQAARWRKVDEGRSPLAVIEWAVIIKITQIIEKEWRHGVLNFLQSPWMQHRTSHIPPSVSGIKDVHFCLFQRLPDGPHINEQVQFLWSSFHTAEPLRTEAAHVSCNQDSSLFVLRWSHWIHGQHPYAQQTEHTHSHTHTAWVRNLYDRYIKDLPNIKYWMELSSTFSITKTSAKYY